MPYHLWMIHRKLTSSVCISQLLAHHSSISAVPVVITHCPPLVLDAHLHSTHILIGASHQTNISICTVATGVDYIYSWDIVEWTKCSILKWFVQVYVPWHLTPASSKWPYWQVTMGLCEHSVRLLSFPLQPMLSRWIWPTPAPKWAPPKAIAPVNIDNFYSNYYKAPIKCAARVCMLTCSMIYNYTICAVYTGCEDWWLPSDCNSVLRVLEAQVGFNSYHYWLFSFLNFTSNHWTFIYAQKRQDAFKHVHTNF